VVPLAGREVIEAMPVEEQKRKEHQDRVESEMRYIIERDRKYESRVALHH
jgi:hypothetical protein